MLYAYFSFLPSSKAYFKKFERDSIELIPPYPEDDDAQEKYLHIIGRISSNLTGDSYKLNAYRSVLITNWLRGYGLARIIADNIRWHNKNKTGKNTATIIRETMRDIEEYARFRFLKYTTCYIDVLKLYLGTKGDCAAIDKIPQLNLWLEFGASKTTQISLMAMGFTRTAALEFSDLIVDENYNKEQCLHWFQTNNIKAFTGCLHRQSRWFPYPMTKRGRRGLTSSTPIFSAFVSAFHFMPLFVSFLQIPHFPYRFPMHRLCVDWR